MIMVHDLQLLLTLRLTLPTPPRKLKYNTKGYEQHGIKAEFPFAKKVDNSNSELRETSQ